MPNRPSKRVKEANSPKSKKVKSDNSEPRDYAIQTRFSDGRIMASQDNYINIWSSRGKLLWKKKLPKGELVLLIRVLQADLFAVHHVQPEGAQAMEIFDSNTYEELVTFSSQSGRNEFLFCNLKMLPEIARCELWLLHWAPENLMCFASMVLRRNHEKVLC